MDKLLEIVNNNTNDLTNNKGSLSKYFLGVNEDLLSYTPGICEGAEPGQVPGQ